MGKTSKIWCVGDIHGCYAELMKLHCKLLNAGMIPEKDIVVFVGDYIDRGPSTGMVIDQMIKWQKEYPHWVFLYGNHEDLMLDALLYNGRIYNSYDLWWQQGGKETAYSYYPDGLSDYEKAISQPAEHIKIEHLGWLAELPWYYENGNYFFVHGGVLPDVALDEQKHFADNGTQKEKEMIKKAWIWARDEFIDSNYDWGKKIVFGHSAAYKSRWGYLGGPIIMENKIGIDGAVCPPAKKNLIAVKLPEEVFYFQEAL
jgi:serine/threonine protein phosphatase 1